MSDLKKGLRETETTAKETWRKADGDESVADKVGNLGDDIRKELGNLGDDIRDKGNDAQREMDRDKDVHNRA